MWTDVQQPLPDSRRRHQRQRGGRTRRAIPEVAATARVTKPTAAAAATHAVISSATPTATTSTTAASPASVSASAQPSERLPAPGQQGKGVAHSKHDAQLPYMH